MTDQNAQRSGAGEDAMQARSALELVARVAELLPGLKANELEELADAVENLTDAIALTIGTAGSDEPDGVSRVAAPGTQ